MLTTNDLDIAIEAVTSFLSKPPAETHEAKLHLLRDLSGKLFLLKTGDASRDRKITALTGKECQLILDALREQHGFGYAPGPVGRFQAKLSIMAEAKHRAADRRRK